MRGDAGLGAVRGSLFHGQCQISEFLAHRLRSAGVLRPVVSEDPGKQFYGVGRGEDAESDAGGIVVPAGRSATGDQDPASGDPVQQWADMGRVLDIVEHKQPPVVPGKPPHCGLGLLLGGLPGQPRVKGPRQPGQPGVHSSRTVGGNPPPHRFRSLRSPARGERRLPDPAQPMHRVDHDLTPSVNAASNAQSSPARPTNIPVRTFDTVPATSAALPQGSKKARRT